MYYYLTVSSIAVTEAVGSVISERETVLSVDYRESIRLSDLATALGYEEHYLSRMINSFFEKGLTSLVNDYRIYHARKLIDEFPEKGLAEIAFECGFGSLRNFNRAYRAAVGRSPRGDSDK